jgi:hypothetical protein
MKNKKGMATPIIITLIVASVLIIILFSTGAFSNTVTSLTPPSAGYDPDKCPDLGVLIAGNIKVTDSSFWELEPSIDEITVDEVKVNNENLLAIGEEPFTYSVTAFDDVTNNKLGRTFKGTGVLKGNDNSGIGKPYSISFTINDLNCDKSIDNFNVRLEGELTGADIGEVGQFSKLIRFREGRILK